MIGVFFKGISWSLQRTGLRWVTMLREFYLTCYLTERRIGR